MAVVVVVVDAVPPSRLPPRAVSPLPGRFSVPILGSSVSGRGRRHRRPYQAHAHSSSFSPSSPSSLQGWRRVSHRPRSMIRNKRGTFRPHFPPHSPPLSFLFPAFPSWPFTFAMPSRARHLSCPVSLVRLRFPVGLAVPRGLGRSKQCVAVALAVDGVRKYRPYVRTYVRRVCMYARPRSVCASKDSRQTGQSSTALLRLACSYSPVVPVWPPHRLPRLSSRSFNLGPRLSSHRMLVPSFFFCPVCLFLLSFLSVDVVVVVGRSWHRFVRLPRDASSTVDSIVGAGCQDPDCG